MTAFLLKQVFLLSLMILIGSQADCQQRFHFTQYMYDMLILNPAYAGADEALSLTFVNRSQWQGIEGSPATQMLTGHTLFKNEHLGLGLTFLNDKIGAHRKLVALGSSSYHIRTSSHSHISLGLQVGVNHRRSDYASLTGTTQYDPHLADVGISNTHLDFGLGTYYRSPRFEAGFSIPELRPQKMLVNDSINIRINKTHLLLFSKLRFPIHQYIDFEPSLLLKYLTHAPLSFDLNANFTYKETLMFGVSYRKSESVDFLLAAYVTPQFRIGYAYDYTIGPVQNLSSGSHELMVGYLLKFSENEVVSPR